MAEQGKIGEALKAFNEAQTYDPAITISASSWNSLCWSGSLHGHAKDVFFACENAVTLEPDSVNYRNSRGLARALTGVLEGAADDFQAVLKSKILDEKESRQRQRWVDALRKGENPFTTDELQALRAKNAP